MSSSRKNSYASSVSSASKGKPLRRPSSYVTLLNNAEKKATTKDHHHRATNHDDRPATYSPFVDPTIEESTKDSLETKLNSPSIPNNHEINKLLLNIKLLKESLRSAALMGGNEFDEELNNHVTGLNSKSDDGIIESTWLVKRAISELHVMYNRQAQGSGRTGGGSVSAEYSLASQLTESRAALSIENESRIKAEKQLTMFEQTWRIEKLQLEDSKALEIESAVSTARREGELATERLAERLKKSDAKASMLEDRARVAERKLEEAKSPSNACDHTRGGTALDLSSNGSKDKRLLALEKQVSTFRRKEGELTAVNISLEAKVDRLAKELRAQRPAPNSRGKVAELAAKVDELDQLLTTSHAELQESRALQHELSSEVGLLSISRAERDVLILELRQTLQDETKRAEQWQVELETVKQSLTDCESTRDALSKQTIELVSKLKSDGEVYQKEMAELMKNSEIELLEATNHVEVIMGKSVKEAEDAKESVMKELCDAKLKFEADLSEKRSELEMMKEAYESKLRLLEEDNMQQLDKARVHCELLAAEELSSREEKGRMQGRIAELTGRLKESQNARLDLQVRVHESSVQCEALSEQLASLKHEISSERQGRANATEEVVDLRDQVAVLRQLERQVQALLEGKKADAEALEVAKEEISKLNKVSEMMKAKDEKLLQLERESKELRKETENTTSTHLLESEEAVAKQVASLAAAEERATTAAASLSSARAAASSQRHTFEKRIAMLEESLRNSERKENEMSKQLATARRNLARRSSRTFDSPSSNTRSPPTASPSILLDTSEREPSMIFRSQDGDEDELDERYAAKSGGSLPRSGTSWLEQRRKPKFYDDSSLQSNPKKLSFDEGVARGLDDSSASPIAPARKAPAPPVEKEGEQGGLNVSMESKEEETLSMDELRKAIELQQKQIERLELSQQQISLPALAEPTEPTPPPVVSSPLRTTTAISPNRVSPPAPSSVPRRLSKTPDTPVYLQQPVSSSSASNELPDTSSKNWSHSSNVNMACTTVWSGVGVHCVRRRCTVQQVWAVEFDRARTTRNTSTQFSSGLGRCGFRASPADSSMAFREMQDEARRRRKEEELQIIKAEKVQTGYSRCASNGVMLEGTVGCEDFVDAAGRWLSLCLSEVELSALGLNEKVGGGGASSGKVDVLDDLNEECTFSPKLNRSSSTKIKPTPNRRNSADPSNSGIDNRSSPNKVSSLGTPIVSGTRKRVSRAPSPTGRTNKGNVKKYDGKPTHVAASSKSSSFDLSDALDNIIGQSALKEQLLAFEKGIELQARRKELGIDCDGAWPPHMMFCGNPGTGKTTIARLVGLVLKKLGVLKRGHLVEVQRSDLVAGAIGQTALKTRDKINEARGGVLFVDEAYTLAPGGGTESKDFGREAINEIMSVMNDGDPVIIFAGYQKEMETFVQANAGLFRRIDVRYDFDNYSTLELAMILRREVTSAGFILDKDVTDSVVAELLDNHTDPHLRSMMGGGLSRQLFRKARGKLDAELSLDATPEVMCTLSAVHLLAGLADITPRPEVAL